MSSSLWINESDWTRYTLDDVPSHFAAATPNPSNDIIGRLSSAIFLSTSLATAAIVYAEFFYQVTKAMYARGNLKRYYPLPTDRNFRSNWGSAFGFITPCTLYAYFVTTKPWSFALPNPLHLALSTIGYMVMHDWFFNHFHRLCHVNKTLYRFLHEAHHEYSTVMNVFAAGYAELLENILQFGIPWVFWTFVIHHLGQQQLWLLIPPLSMTVFTTLVGHSGYRYHRVFVAFHPLIIPFVFTKYMLTPGEHQVHHSHRRYNFGLFFRFWDKHYGTYKRVEAKAQDVTYWTKFVREDDRYSAGRDKRKVAIHLVETAWGF